MKYLSALLVFALALMLQLWFAPAGMRGDFALATLIVFAFLFPFWELVVFVLCGIFLLNPSLYPGLAMIMLAAIPLVMYAIRRHFSLDPWLGAAFGVTGGIILFYVVTAPVAASHAIGFFVLDILACIIFGEFILCGMVASN